MNNLERIKNLNQEEMAEFLIELLECDKSSLDTMACGVCPYFKKHHCQWDKENEEHYCFFGDDEKLIMKTVLESESYNIME